MGSRGKFVAFDFGASTGRAVAAEISEGAFAMRELYRFENRPVEIRGRIYWDFPALYAGLLEGLRAFAARYGPVADGVGVDTWGCDFGQLDRNGELLRLPAHYRDNRTEGTEEVIERELGRKELYSRTGTQFLVFNTLNQLIAMRDRRDVSLDVTDALLFMPDLFHYCLTGVKASEFTVASISQLYNVNECAWDERVCAAFGIPPRILQRVAQPGFVLADISAGVARDTGVSGPVILPATHDTASAAAAVPSLEHGATFISSGTWSIVGLELSGPAVNEMGFARSFSNSGGAFGTCLLVKNVMGLWIIQRCREGWARRGRALSFADIERAAASSPSVDAFIDPDDARFLNPRDMLGEILRSAAGSVPRSLDESDVGAVARLVFESLAMKYRYTIENLAVAAGTETGPIHVVGGGARNDLLNQLTADATGREVLAGPVEATAIGNVAVQAIGAGFLESLASARRLIRNEFPPVEYRRKGDTRREVRYEHFLESTGLTRTP